MGQRLLTASDVEIECAIAKGWRDEYILERLVTTQADITRVGARMEQINNEPETVPAKPDAELWALARAETAKVYRSTVPEHNSRHTPLARDLTAPERHRLAAASRRDSSPPEVA